MAVLAQQIEDLKYEMGEEASHQARIKVVGIGGGGSNAVAHMMSAGLEGVEFHVIDTDAQALAASPVPNKLVIGSKKTCGRGAGGDPAVGRQAVLDDTERVLEILNDADMVFVTAGLGGGVGTGGAPVVASLAKQLNAVTVAVVTKPFGLEGSGPMRQAEKGLGELAAIVDTVIAVPNDRLLALAPPGASVLEAFRLGYDLLRQTVENIVELNTVPGLINRDFSNLRAIIKGSGCARMGTAVAKGEKAVLEAARQAINCPLLEETGIKGARHVLINITASHRLGLHEFAEACGLIRQAAECDDVRISFGIVLKESMADAVKVTVVAAGLPRREAAAGDGQKPLVREAVIRPPELPLEPAPAQEPPVVSAAAPLPPLEPPEALEELDIPAYQRQGKLLQ
jgi:cell division protein FtsZ